MSEGTDQNVLELSDEEILNMPEPGTEPTPEIDSEEPQASAPDAEDSEQEDDDNDAPQGSGQSDDDEEEEDSQSESDDDEEEEEGQESEDNDPYDADDSEEEEDDEPEAKASKDKGKIDKSIEEAEDIPAEIDYEAEYKRLTAPFRANGIDMQVQNVDDAIHLMQMGANYNKKMRALKPSLKILKMLENNELLDESKLNHLIDISKQDPAAIMKLVQDSGIDPLEMDLEKTVEYRPNTYTVDDKEVELDSVLQDIQSTETFQETIDIISNKWDSTSKKVVLDNPVLIAQINDQVANGIYGQINAVMQRERVLGRLAGMSDLDAYRAIGEAMQAQGAFDSLGQTQSLEQETTPKATAETKPRPKAKVDPKLKSRKRAAANTKGSVTKKQGVPDFNPLALSDEDFDKVSAPIT